MKAEQDINTEAMKKVIITQIHSLQEQLDQKIKQIEDLKDACEEKMRL